MPWDDSCAWNTGTSVPSGENAAGYISSISYSQVCEDITIPENGGGSGGGGGVTTPIPPGTYDPCNGNTPRPLEVVFNKGTRLMVVPPTPCDGGGIGGSTGSNPANTKLNIITNNFGIYDVNKQNYLLNNQPVFFAFNDYVLNNGTSSEDKAFLDWAVGYLMENPNSFEDFKRNVLVIEADQSFNDSDADNNNTLMDLNNIGNASFNSNGFDVFTPSAILPDYGLSHPVSQAIKNFNPWIYYAFVGSNNTSLAHFHLTAKGMDAGDGYRKAIGAIGEGLFVSRLTSLPTSPPASLFIAKMFGTTHIDALVVRKIPFVNGSGYEIAINYTDLNGDYQQKRMKHPDGLTMGPIKETTISYEVKTLNAAANTPESILKALKEGVKQTRHRAGIPYMSASILVFDEQAWNKLKSSSLSTQAINEINSMSSVKNPDGEQKIYFRIEKNLTRDAIRAFYGLRDKIKNL